MDHCGCSCTQVTCNDIGLNLFPPLCRDSLSHCALRADECGLFPSTPMAAIFISRIITIQPGLQRSSFAHFIILKKKKSLENSIFCHLFEASCRHLIKHFNVVLLSVPCTKTVHGKLCRWTARRMEQLRGGQFAADVGPQSDFIFWNCGCSQKKICDTECATLTKTCIPWLRNRISMSNDRHFSTMDRVEQLRSCGTIYHK